MDSRVLDPSSKTLDKAKKNTARIAQIQTWPAQTHRIHQCDNQMWKCRHINELNTGESTQAHQAGEETN